MPDILGLIILLLFAGVCHSQELYAPIGSGGLRGNVSFAQLTPTSVKIIVSLKSMSEDAVQSFDWAVHEFPVMYDLKNPCHINELGKSIYDLSRVHGQLVVAKLEARVFEFNDSNLQLSGLKTIWGRSIYFRSSNSSSRACTNVMASDEKIKTAVSTFTHNVVGNIIFRENNQHETIIYSNLYFDDQRSGSKNDWRVMVTDILDTSEHFKCNQLSILLDPDNIDEAMCAQDTPQHCKMGNMVQKHGQMIIGTNNNRYSKRFFVDTNFSLDLLDSNRKVYVVIVEKNTKKILACANIVTVQPKEVKAHFNQDGVKGEFTFKQNYKMDPTIIHIKLSNLRGRGKFYRIHEFPIVQRQSKEDNNLCSAAAVGGRYNPFGSETKLAPAAGTNDQYELGDLSGKHGTFNEAQDMQDYFNIHLDFNLPLFGLHSIVGRSIVINRADGGHWVCANIAHPDKTNIARAVFHYPVVGQIVFRQEENDNHLAETTIFGELYHLDAKNLSAGHVWRIHEYETGRDFYNWTRRCMSTGDTYNPFGVSAGRNYHTQCTPDNQLRCQLGSMYLKHRRIDLNTFYGNESVKFFFTDLMLPLSGPNSIIGRSVVIEDENGALIRGKRLACTTIRRHHPLMAQVDYWRYSSSVGSNITGSVVFSQTTEFDETKGVINLKGLNQIAGGYHIHKVSVPLDKEFPCSGDTIYGHYNPFESDSAIGPFPGVGSVDEYEVGDLSGKFGMLDFLEAKHETFQDFTLSLIGKNSIVGRSVVIHKKDNNFRWLCGTIKPKVNKNEREIVAMASFDDPRHLIKGYIRFRQIEYPDGSLSDTWIESYLKHRDINKKITYGHAWKIYVNSVGSDAYNIVDSVRCIAGGFIYNPYLTTIDDAYRAQCRPTYSDRCALGDLSGRHGPLSIGSDRTVYADSHLQFTGNYSILNRALVIFMKNETQSPLACANIKIDKHLIATVVVQKIPAFTVAKFMQHMRNLLNAADWIIVAEVQKNRELRDNECIQILVHFYGDDAWRLQSEFSNLIEYGSVRRQSNGEVIKTYYKSCKASDSPNSAWTNVLNKCLILLLLPLMFILS